MSRSFTSFSQAASEAGFSRILGGIHFEFSNQDGQSTGRAVADAVWTRFSVSDDVAAPSVLFLTPQADLTYSSAPEIRGWVLDNLSGVASATIQLDDNPAVALSLDGSGQFVFEPNLLTDGTADGSHTVRVVATDMAGLTSDAFTFEFTFDTRVPTIAVSSPASDTTVSAGQRLEGTVSGTGSPIVWLAYRVNAGPWSPMSVDSSTGNFSHSLDLSRLSAGTHNIQIIARDSAGLEATLSRSVVLAQSIRLAISGHTPLAGSSDVGSTFRPQVDFSRPVDKATLTSASFYATDTTGSKLPATIVPSADGSFAWLFLANPMPGSSTISVTVNGDFIRALDGSLLDADNNGVPGGSFKYSFTTVSLSSLPNTSIRGRVVDPGNDLRVMTIDDVLAGADGSLHTADDVFSNPIAGAKVFILGRESQAVFTDGNGFFELNEVPAGTIKLAVDGRTATNTPDGIFWPEMVMDLELDAGYVNTVMGSMGSREERAANIDRTEVYLPRLQTSILKSISSTETTTVTVDPAASPNLTSEQRANLKLEVIPGSIIGENGQPVSNPRIGISTVPPELVRDMLPPGLLQHTFDLTIQSPDAATFNTPLRMTFPNVFNAAPATKLNFLSFDHTTGRLVIEGTATVSTDGKSVMTDTGTGVSKPGWHGLTPPGSGAEPPCKPNTTPNQTVVPIPSLPASGNYYLSAKSNSLSLRFANNARNTSGGKCDSTNETPMVVTISVSDTGYEFLNAIASHSFTLSPSESRTITISSKDILDQLPKIARDRLYGATIDVRAFRWGELNAPIASEKINVYRFYDVSDAIPNDGVIQVRETVVERKLKSSTEVLTPYAEMFRSVHMDSITVVTHGWLPEYIYDGDNLMPLARAIYNDKNATNSHVWFVDYDVDEEGSVGRIDERQSILPQLGEQLAGVRGHVVLLFDWAVESNELSTGWAEAAADALVSMIVGLELVKDFGKGRALPIHLIGHSFGSVVTSEAARRFIQAGHTIDQVTYLDPHDFVQSGTEIEFVDEAQAHSSIVGGYSGYGVNAWNGVDFTDVYYETRGFGSTIDTIVPRGRPIPGAYNVFLDTELPVSPDSLAGDHSYVWEAYYIASITGAIPSDQQGPATPFEFFKTGYQFQKNKQLREKRESSHPDGVVSSNFANIPVQVTQANPNGHLLMDRRSLPHTTVISKPDPIGNTVFVVSDRSLVDPNGIPNPQIPYTKKSPPPANQLSLQNGDLDRDPLNWDGAIPGWSHHGGGGNGDIKSRGNDGFLELSVGNEFRTHNWFFVPKEANSIQFDYRVTKTSQDDLLQLYIDDVAIGDPITLKNIIKFQDRVAMPEKMKGEVHTLTFKIVSVKDGIEAVIELDNIKMSTELATASADLQFASSFEFVLGSTPRPSISLSLESGPLTFAADTIRFNPDVVGVMSTNTLTIGGASGSRQTEPIQIPITAIAAKQSTDPAKKSPGSLAIYDKNERGVFRNEFKLGTAGTPSKHEFMFYNQGESPLLLTQVLPAWFVLNSSGLTTSLSDIENLVIAPNQSIPFTVEYSGQGTDYKSTKFVFNTGGGTGEYGSSKRFEFDFWVAANESSGSGEGPNKSVLTGLPLSYGGDYVLINFPSVGGAPPIRLRSDEQGNFEAFLPPDQPIHFAIFDPVSGLVSHSYQLSSSTGQSTQLTTPYFVRSQSRDTDSDGIPDDIENILGTSLFSEDSNSDGISDLAAIRQGLDPLAGRPVVTGIVANLPLQGEAKQIVVVSDIDDVEKRTAYIAAGSNGLAIVEASQFNKPTLVGQIDLPGDAVDVAVDGSLGVAAVATGSNLVLVDVSNPQQPVVVTSIAINATQVEISEGIVYVAVGGGLRSYALRSGTLIQSLSLGSASVTGLAREGEMLYSMDSNGTLRAIDISGLIMVAKGSLAMPQDGGGGGLFVGNGIAYVPAQRSIVGGYATVDVSNPDNLSLIANSAASPTSAAPDPYLVTNGSGLGVVAVGGGLGVPPSINIYDVRDPANTDAFVTSFPLQTQPASVTIAGGIAYVASGTGGLQIVNYRAFDDRGITPTVTISADASLIDIAPNEDGIQILEGFSVPINSLVDDDVQVRSVELLVNGNVVSSSLSFPFNLASVAPILPDGVTTGEFTVQARATDTGGNSTLSNVITLQIRPDNSPPLLSVFNVAMQDVDNTKPGIQILEGEPLFARFAANDIGGINRVELMENGHVIQTQKFDFGVFGFEAPILDNGESSRSVTLQIRVWDNAGNAALSSEVRYELVPDTIVPKIVSMNLRNGDVKSVGAYWLNIEFDKNISPSSLTNDSFHLVNPSGQTIAAEQILIPTPRSVQVQYSLPIAGAYDLTIEAPLIRDLGGNSLGEAPLVYRFEATNNAILFPRTQLPAGMAPQAIVTADINGDGKLDLVTSNVDTNNLLIFMGNGDGTFAPAVTHTIGNSSGWIAIEDLNSDGRLDLVMTHFNANNLSVLYGNGDGTFGAATSYDLPDKPSYVKIWDLNEDGLLDLTVTIYAPQGSVAILYGRADGLFHQADVFTVGSYPYSVSIADLDEDGVLDLIVAYADTISPTVHLGNGDGTFTPKGSLAIGRNPIHVAIKDLNGDGWLDLVTSNVRYRDITVLLGAGDGTFPTSAIYEVGVSPHMVAIEDIDGDGRLDLITPNYDSNDVSILLGNGDGTFGIARNISVGAGPRTIAIGDFNADGRLDISTANRESHNVSVLLNLRNGQALHAAISSSHSPEVIERLDPFIAAPLIESAKQNWQALGMPMEQLNGLSFVIVNLPGAQLGYAVGKTIYLDEDAAGWGWFIDQTPDEQEEFELHDSEWLAVSEGASQQMDLLTVITHELGHVLGLEDLFHDDLDLMSHALDAGVRRLPSAKNVDQIFGIGRP